MVAMVPLLTPVSGYYTTFYNHIAMVLTPLRDLGKTMAEPHSILQGYKTELWRHVKRPSLRATLHIETVCN